MWLFQAFFIPQLLQSAVVGGCYLQPRPGTAGQYIESHLRKKWEDWKKYWFYTTLPDHPQLWLPAPPPPPRTICRVVGSFRTGRGVRRCAGSPQGPARPGLNGGDGVRRLLPP